MKVIKQEVQLFGNYDWDQIKYHIANAGGVCYNKPKETPEEISAFLCKLSKMRHFSVLEHCNVSFKIVTSRSMLAQITRHRHMSFSVQSTRYCRFKDDLLFVEPENKSMIYRETWKLHMTLAENAYLSLLEHGIPPEEARDILPMSLATTMIMTGNLRAWKEYIELRSGNGTQKQHKELVEMMNMILSNYLPEIFLKKEVK